MPSPWLGRMAPFALSRGRLEQYGARKPDVFGLILTSTIDVLPSKVKDCVLRRQNG